MKTDNHQFILAFLSYATQRDVNPEKLCQLAGIDLDNLRTGNTRSLEQPQLEQLWLNVMNLTKDPLFGLHFGESLQLSALGAVGEIIKSSSTVGKAITIACSLAYLITPMINLRVSHNKTSFIIHFDSAQKKYEKHVSYKQTLDLLMVFVIHELNGLILKKIKPLKIKYKNTINYIKEYERIMRCEPQFSKHENSMAFPSIYWNEPILSSNHGLQEILVSQHQHLLMQPLNESSFQTKVSNYLLSNSYLSLVSIEQIAANFNISTRTLQRRLKLEGTSFQQIADEARKALSIQYLSTGEYAVKEIAHMLGYNEISAFTRTFKRWTGMAPSGFLSTSNNLPIDCD